MTQDTFLPPFDLYALQIRDLLAEARPGEMMTRVLGRTGERVSAIGLGGYHLGFPSAPEVHRIIRTAIDEGITFMDNCWDYHDGESERRMGHALRDGYRQKVFLMTKIDGHTRAAAARQIDESLRRLQTDHVDLLQFHEIIRMSDPVSIVGPNGALEAALQAKKAGKIRYIGFTGHKHPDVHLKMLRSGFLFDAVQMPLNVMDAHFRSFQQKVLPVAHKLGVGVLGMKALGAGFVLKSGQVEALECLRYVLSLPVSVLITGCETLRDVHQAASLGRDFSPMGGEEAGRLLARTREAALSGQFEPFKTSGDFDGTEQNPQWLA